MVQPIKSKWRLCIGYSILLEEKSLTMRSVCFKLSEPGRDHNITIDGKRVYLIDKTILEEDANETNTISEALPYLDLC